MINYNYYSCRSLNKTEEEILSKKDNCLKTVVNELERESVNDNDNDIFVKQRKGTNSVDSIKLKNLFVK